MTQPTKLSDLFNVIVPEYDIAVPVIVLNTADKHYYDSLIDSILVYADTIEYFGKVKRIYQDNHFSTIQNEKTWNQNQKILWESYIRKRFSSGRENDDPIINFNQWCKSKEIAPPQVTVKELSFLKNEKFNLIFTNTYGVLSCYAKIDTDKSNQIIHLANKDNTLKFWTIISDYLRYDRRIPELAYHKNDSIIISTLQKELNLGNHFIKNNEIKLISNNPKSYCYGYINLKFMQNLKKCDTEAWDSFLSQFNVEDRELFKAWIYSIFVEEDINRQILWIEGEGATGKSTVTSTISEILYKYNPCLFKAIPNDFKDLFALTGFDLARLALVANCTDKYLIKNKEIQNITGNDHISIREIQQGPKTKRVFIKIMVTSNYSPVIDKKLIHETSRMLHIKMLPHLVTATKKKWKSSKKSYETRLNQQFWAFIAKSKDAYLELKNNDGSLKVSHAKFNHSFID